MITNDPAYIEALRIENEKLSAAFVARYPYDPITVAVRLTNIVYAVGPYRAPADNAPAIAAFEIELDRADVADEAKLMEAAIDQAPGIWFIESCDLEILESEDAARARARAVQQQTFSRD